MVVVVGAGTSTPPWLWWRGEREEGWEGRGHCGAPAVAGTGVLRTLVAAERTGEPVRGPRAVEAGSAEIPVIMLAVLTAGFPPGRLADPATRDWSFTMGKK